MRKIFIIIFCFCGCAKQQSNDVKTVDTLFSVSAKVNSSSSIDENNLTDYLDTLGMSDLSKRESILYEHHPVEWLLIRKGKPKYWDDFQNITYYDYKYKDNLIEFSIKHDTVVHVRDLGPSKNFSLDTTEN